MEGMVVGKSVWDKGLEIAKTAIKNPVVTHIGAGIAGYILRPTLEQYIIHPAASKLRRLGGKKPKI